MGGKLTEVKAGQLLSFKSYSIGMPRLSRCAEGNTGSCGEPGGALRSLSGRDVPSGKTVRCTTLLHYIDLPLLRARFRGAGGHSNTRGGRGQVGGVSGGTAGTLEDLHEHIHTRRNLVRCRTDARAFRRTMGVLLRIPAL